MRMLAKAMFGLTVVLVFVANAQSGAKSKIAKEAAEYVVRKFGKEAVTEGTETLAKRIEQMALKHGDETFEAVKKVGPRTFRIMEEAGEHSGAAIKLMARHGDDAVWVVSKPNRMAIFIKHGDDAATAMMKHKEIIEPLLETYGKTGASALKSVNEQNGRRLVMMAQDGDLAKIGKTTELFDIVTKKGDEAMNFIWRNKEALAVTACLTRFLADPQPFIDGTKDITLR